MDILWLCVVVVVSILILGFVRKRVRTALTEGAQNDPAKAKKLATNILLGVGVAVFLMIFYLACKHVFAADPSACNTVKEGNPLLAPPASARDVKYLRCGSTDKVVFRVLRAFPAESLSDLMLKRWKDKGWLPSVQSNDAWASEMSADRLHVRRYRRFTFENAKGGTAFLILEYTVTFTEPVTVLLSEQIDPGDDLHVEAVMTPAQKVELKFKTPADRGQILAPGQKPPVSTIEESRKALQPGATNVLP